MRSRNKKSSISSNTTGTKMRLLKFIFLLCFLNYVTCKTHSRPLTESMGQEVIEIGAPIKELPQELEEEPSADSGDERLTTTVIQAATKKESIKSTFTDPGNKLKHIGFDDTRPSDDDEDRIAKEFAEMYKDSIDYKGDSAEDTKEVNATKPSKAPPSKSPTTSDTTTSKRTTTKPAERARKEFKFQPDSNDPRDIASFRTSIDEISCDKKLSATEIPGEKNTASDRLVADLILTILLYTVCI